MYNDFGIDDPISDNAYCEIEVGPRQWCLYTDPVNKLFSSDKGNLTQCDETKCLITGGCKYHATVNNTMDECVKDKSTWVVPAVVSCHQRHNSDQPPDHNTFLKELSTYMNDDISCEIEYGSEGHPDLCVRKEGAITMPADCDSKSSCLLKSGCANTWIALDVDKDGASIEPGTYGCLTHSDEITNFSGNESDCMVEAEKKGYNYAAYNPDYWSSGKAKCYGNMENTFVKSGGCQHEHTFKLIQTPKDCFLKNAIWTYPAVVTCRKPST